MKFINNPYLIIRCACLKNGSNSFSKKENTWWIKKNINIEYGYHDQCIFLCNKNIIKEKLELLINQKYEEYNFLDILKYLDNVSYYETKYPLKSFNTKNEL
jgi:hypothetical protein